MMDGGHVGWWYSIVVVKTEEMLVKTGCWSRQVVGQDRLLVKTEVVKTGCWSRQKWSRQVVGRDRLLVETGCWSRQVVGQEVVKTGCWSRSGQDRSGQEWIKANSYHRG